MSCEAIVSKERSTVKVQQVPAKLQKDATFLHQCPYCQRMITTSDAYRGHLGMCPYSDCRHEIRVPLMPPGYTSLGHEPPAPTSSKNRSGKVSTVCTKCGTIQECGKDKKVYRCRWCDEQIFPYVDLGNADYKTRMPRFCICCGAPATTSRRFYETKIYGSTFSAPGGYTRTTYFDYPYCKKCKHHRKLASIEILFKLMLWATATFFFSFFLSIQDHRPENIQLAKVCGATSVVFLFLIVPGVYYLRKKSKPFGCAQGTINPYKKGIKNKRYLSAYWVDNRVTFARSRGNYFIEYILGFRRLDKQRGVLFNVDGPPTEGIPMTVKEYDTYMMSSKDQYLLETYGHNQHYKYLISKWYESLVKYNCARGRVQ